MIARLDKNLATQYLLLAAKTALDNITKLFMISQLLKAGFIKQTEGDGAYCAPFVCVRPILEVAENSRIRIDCVFCSWIQLREIKDFFIRNFNHVFLLNHVILMQLLVINGASCCFSQFYC